MARPKDDESIWVKIKKTIGALPVKPKPEADKDEDK
jgi:hypothetical protein